MKRSSVPLVSSVPTTSTTGEPAARAGRGSAIASTLAGPAEAMRAFASIRALGTGCDHRVGGVGLET